MIYSIAIASLLMGCQDKSHSLLVFETADRLNTSHGVAGSIGSKDREETVAIEPTEFWVSSDNSREDTMFVATHFIRSSRMIFSEMIAVIDDSDRIDVDDQGPIFWQKIFDSELSCLADSQLRIFDISEQKINDPEVMTFYTPEVIPPPPATISGMTAPISDWDFYLFVCRDCGDEREETIAHEVSHYWFNVCDHNLPYDVESFANKIEKAYVESIGKEYKSVRPDLNAVIPIHRF